MTPDPAGAGHGTPAWPRPDQDCPDSACVTCSDGAEAGSILALGDDGLATVVLSGRRQQVSVALVAAEVGDTVLVHAGEAIAVVPR